MYRALREFQTPLVVKRFTFAELLETLGGKRVDVAKMGSVMLSSEDLKGTQHPTHTACYATSATHSTAGHGRVLDG